MNGLVLLFPGQGSQAIGMGRSLVERFASVDRLFQEASDIVGQDMKKLCFEGPEATLVQTHNVQPAITLVNLAVLQVLREHGVEPAAAAGHSLGEYAALTAADVFSVADVMRLVHVRGAAMQQAAQAHPGGMVAVFGLGIDSLRAICDELSGVGSVEVANHNSPTQVALTGETEALKKAGEMAKARGAKLVVPLKVSGPWHSRFMAAAQGPMQEALDSAAVNPPSIPVLSNVTAEPHGTDPDGIRAALVSQLVSPVRWVDSIAALMASGHRTFVEAGPGKVLSGLMRDISREVSMFNVQDAETLEKFQAARPGMQS